MKAFWAWLCSKVSKKEQKKEEHIKPEVNSNGMCKVMVENIDTSPNEVLGIHSPNGLKMSYTSFEIFADVKVPTHVLKLVRTLSGSMIGHTVLEIQTASATDFVAQDKARALALASCFYDFYVPYNAILIDGLTKLYMHRIMRRQVSFHHPVSAPPRVLKGSADYAKYDLPPEELIKRYVAMIPHIGAVLNNMAGYPILPPDVAMVAEIKSRAGNILKALNGRKMPTDAEIFMMITAFASIAKIKIPPSYANLGVTTSYLTNEIRYSNRKPPQLSVVNNK